MLSLCLSLLQLDIPVLVFISRLKLFSKVKQICNDVGNQEIKHVQALLTNRRKDETLTMTLGSVRLYLLTPNTAFTGFSFTSHTVLDIPLMCRKALQFLWYCDYFPRFPWLYMMVTLPYQMVTQVQLQCTFFFHWTSVQSFCWGHVYFHLSDLVVL